jgi:hypothetical protein
VNLTLIVTIDPVKSLPHLDVLVHALNLQTCKDFDVVFFNQTLRTAAEIVAGLRVSPVFPIRTFDVPRDDFLGLYPIWDLYAFHSHLLEKEPVGDYIMSLHMEEFPDVDYVEHLLGVLKRERLDILFGNLCNTKSTLEDVEPLLETKTVEDFDRAMTVLGLKTSPRWGFDHRPVLLRRNPRLLLENLQRWTYFRFRKTLPATAAGFTTLGRYVAEDIFAMSAEFARRHNWFLRGHHLYFEDIHILNHRAVGDLTGPLRARTKFPVYFNRRRMYHVRHRRFYFQLEDETFTTLLLGRTEEDPALLALQHAIREYRSGRLSLEQALTYTRRNPDRSGTQNLNFRYHMRYLAPEAIDAGER